MINYLQRSKLDLQKLSPLTHEESILYDTIYNKASIAVLSSQLSTRCLDKYPAISLSHPHLPLIETVCIFYVHPEAVMSEEDALVVKMLLRRGAVNPDQPNNNGQTLLRSVPLNGHERALKILLGRDDVNPGKLHNGGQTPLDPAVSKEHEGVVKI